MLPQDGPVKIKGQYILRPVSHPGEPGKQSEHRTIGAGRRWMVLLASKIYEYRYEASAIKCVSSSLFPIIAILFFVFWKQIKDLLEGGLDSSRTSHDRNVMYSVCRSQ